MIKSASLGPRSRLKLIRRDPPAVGHNCEYVKARNALILEAVKIADSLVEVLPPGQGDDEAVNESRSKWARAFSIAMDTLSEPLL